MRHFLFEYRVAFVLIAAYALLAHSLFLVNNLPYWDGWIYHVGLLNHDYAALLAEWRNNGRLLLGKIYLGLGTELGMIYGFHILIVSAILLSAFLFYSTLIRHTLVDRFSCLTATLLGCSYPAYQVHLASTTFAYIVALPFFLSGCLLLLEAKDKNRPDIRLLLRLLAHGAFLISYITEAYVIAGFSIPFILWALNRRDVKTLPSLIAYYKRYSDFLLVAFVYAGLAWLCMPVGGAYAHSRDLNLSPGSVAFYYIMYLSSSLNWNIVNPLPALRTNLNLILWILLLISGGILYYKRPSLERRKYLYQALTAVIIISAIAVPFVLAQRKTTTQGWDMRHVTPVGFLASLVLVSTVCYFIQNPKWRRRVLTCVTIMSLIVLNRNYTMWELRSAFDHGVMEHMRDEPVLKEASIIFTGYNQVFFHETYRGYEWTAMLKTAYNDTKNRWVIFDEKKFSPPNWRETAVADVEAEGIVERDSCQASFELIPQPPLHLSNGLYYVWLRMTANEEELTAWTKTLVKVKVTALKNCHAV